MRVGNHGKARPSHSSVFGITLFQIESEDWSFYAFTNKSKQLKNVGLAAGLNLVAWDY